MGGTAVVEHHATDRDNGWAIMLKQLSASISMVRHAHEIRSLPYPMMWYWVVVGWIG